MSCNYCISNLSIALQLLYLIINEMDGPYALYLDHVQQVHHNRNYSNHSLVYSSSCPGGPASLNIIITVIVN